MNEIALALSAALLWGCGDFVGGGVTRRLGVWPTQLVVHLVGAAIAAAALAFRGAIGPNGLALGAALEPGVVAGVAFAIGLGALYAGIGRGRVGVVAPVAGMLAVILPVLGAAIGGAAIGPFGVLGVLTAVAAVALLGLAPPSPPEAGAPARLGVGASAAIGAVAGAGLGTVSLALGHAEAAAGALEALLVTRLVAAGVAAALALILAGAALRPNRIPATALLAGALDGGGALLFVLALEVGRLAVAAPIAALYPAVTVTLGIWLLRERLGTAQALGLALSAASVLALSL